MARPRKLTENDAELAYGWLRRMIVDIGRSDTYFRADGDEIAARKELMSFAPMERAKKAVAVQEFADNWLTPQAWTAMRNAMRQKQHSRGRSHKMIVRVAPKTHLGLSRIAAADGVTLEAVIARLVEREASARDINIRR